MTVENFLIPVALIMTLLPLGGCVVAGLFGRLLGDKLTHRIVVAAIGASFLLSCYLFNQVVINSANPVDHVFYVWANSGVLNFNVGFLIDNLSATCA